MVAIERQEQGVTLHGVDLNSSLICYSYLRFVFNQFSVLLKRFYYILFWNFKTPDVVFVYPSLLDSCQQL